jgi:predicted ArsR family transcriptional regulator
MGLLDEMAQANRDMHTKPDGWMTTQAFADASGISWANAKRVLSPLVESGQLESRKWKDPSTGKVATIYGEPV